jgi:hypothetical protein
MRKLLSAVVVLLVMDPGTAAAAAHRHRCAMRGSKTLKDDGRTRVFVRRYKYEDDAFYTCLYRIGRRHRLDENCEWFSRFRLRTPYVTSACYDSGSGFVGWDLLLQDVRTGRTVPLGEFGDSPYGYGDDFTGLELSHSGTVAWIRRSYGSTDTGPYVHRSVETRGARWGDTKVLDPGPGVDGGSLAMTRKGRRIYWTAGGVPRTARLRPRRVR